MPKVEEFIWLNNTYLLNSDAIAFCKVGDDESLTVVIAGVSPENSKITIAAEQAGSIIKQLRNNPQLLPKATTGEKGKARYMRTRTPHDDDKNWMA